MEWYDLLKLTLKDNPDALKTLDVAKTNFTTLQENLDTSTARFEEAKTTRDASKTKLKSITKLFGVDNADKLNADFLKELTAKREDTELQKALDLSVAQVGELQQGMLAKGEELTNMTNAYETKLSDYRFNSEASNTMANVPLKDNPHIINSFKTALLADVKDVNGILTPHKLVGEQLIPMTKADGSFMTLNDKRDDMVKDAMWSDFLVVNVSGGNGNGNGNPNPTQSTKAVKDMTTKEKYAHYEQKLAQ